MANEMEVLAMGITVVKKCAAVILLATSARALPVDTIDDLKVDTRPAVVVGIDCSASMRTAFAQVIDRVDGMLRLLPDDSSLALVHFDEQAAELARTSCLSANQRQTIRSRLHSLKAAGEWTNFEVAAQQIRASAELLQEPLLVVVFTDRMSDPGPTHAFESLDNLLHEAFADREGVSMLLVVPEREIDSQIEEHGNVHVAELAKISAENILSHVPSQQVVLPVEPPHSHPGFVGVAVGASLAASAFCFIFLRDWAQARQLRSKHREQPSARDLSCDLIARCDENTFNLGPVDEIEHLRLGTGAGCDIRAVSAEDQEIDVVVHRRSSRFFVTNRSKFPIHVNRAELDPGETGRLRLPAQLVMEGLTTISLALLPKAEELEIEQGAAQHAAEEVEKCR